MIDSIPFTIVIPSHCRADLLRGCLKSLQTYAPKLARIIVVDDASPNGIVSTAAQEFARVEVIRHSTQGGFCAAVNTGLKVVRTKYLQLLNDDTEVTSYWHRTPLEWLSIRNDISAIAPLVLRYANPDLIDSAGDEYLLGGIARPRGKGKLVTSEYLSAREVAAVSACGGFYRSDALRSIGGFPEHFVAYFDDVDVSMRLRKAGGSIWYCPESRILHHGSASLSAKLSPAMVEQVSRNEERVFRDHAPKTASTWCCHSCILAAKAARRAYHRELMPFLKGRWKAWREYSLHAGLHHDFTSK